MSGRPRFLVFGASGLLGRNLRTVLSPDDALMTYCSTPFAGGVRFDPLTQRLRDLGREAQRCTHALILFADSKPDSCLANPSRSQAINVDCLRPLVGDLLSAGIAPTFISTEFVFDGTRGLYSEDDAPRPILLYGRQKLAAERLLLSLDPSVLILRLAKCFGADANDGTLFTHWLEEIGRGTRRLRCATDQAFSPLHAEDAARAMLAAASRGLSGIYHLAGDRRYTRMSLLDMLLAEVRRHTAVELTVEPCRIRDFPLPEPRPVDVTLCAARLRAAGCLRCTPVEQHCAAITAAWLEASAIPR